MLRIVQTYDPVDSILPGFLQRNDPFWLATLPLREVMRYLPPETINTFTIKPKGKIMPIKNVVEQSQAPVRLKARSGVSRQQDWIDVISEINKGTLRSGKAIILELSSETVASYKDPSKAVVMFAGQLRRYFSVNAIMATAYQSGPNEITIKTEKRAPVPEGLKKKK